MGFLSEKLKEARGRPVMIGSGFLTAVFNTVALLIIARNAGPEILGTLGFMLAFMGFFMFVGDLGYGLAFERLVARGLNFHRCYRVFIRAKLRLTIYMAVLSGILIVIYANFLEPEGHTALHPVAMVMMLGYFAAANLAGIWVLSARLRRKRAASHDLIESLAKVAMVVGLFWFFEPGGDQEIIFRLAFIYLVAGTIGMMLVRNSARSIKAGEGDDEIELELHDVSKKFIPFTALVGLVLCLDKVALWAFTDFHTLGIYFGAQRITVFIAASAVMIEAILGEALSKHIKENRTKDVSDTLRMTERYVSLLALPVAAFYVVFANSLLNAFLGERFAGAGLTVALLAGAGLFAGLASPHISYIVRADRFREMAMVAGSGVTAFLAALGLLLPGLVLSDAGMQGMNGAAAAVLASSLAAYGCARFLTWKILDCKPHPRMWAHALCAGLMMAVIHFVMWYFSIELNFGWLILTAILGFFTYVLCLYLTGEMVRRDFLEFRRLTKPE